MPTTPPRPSRPAFTLVELLVIIAIIGILIAQLLPAVQAARRSECINKLKQSGLAMQDYHTARNEFPPGVVIEEACCANRSMGAFTGWSIEILPYMEDPALLELHDEKALPATPRTRPSERPSSTSTSAPPTSIPNWCSRKAVPAVSGQRRTHRRHASS